MAMLMMDSMHGYADADDTETRFARRGGGSWFNSGSTTGGPQLLPHYSFTGNSQEAFFNPGSTSGGPKTLFIGMWVWIAETESTHEFIRMLDMGGTRQGGFFISQAGGIHAIRSNSTIVARAQNCFVPQTWNFWESKYRVDNTTGDYIVKVNGEEVIRSTGVDSQGTGNPRIRQVLFECETGQTTRISQIWMWDDTGSVFNDFIGPRRLVQLYPSAPGGNTDWTSTASGTSTNWELVIDEPVTSTDFVEASSTGATDQHQFDNLSTNVNGVECVQVVACVRPTDETGMMVQPFLESTGTEGTGRASLPGANDYTGNNVRTFIPSIFETDPNGSIGWTPAALNIARVGIRTVVST